MDGFWDDKRDDARDDAETGCVSCFVCNNMYERCSRDGKLPRLVVAGTTERQQLALSGIIVYTHTADSTWLAIPWACRTRGRSATAADRSVGRAVLILSL